MKISGLYIITDSNRDGRLEERIEAALRGGARIVQYRDKSADLTEQERMARRLAQLCREHRALFLINDSPQLAVAVGADGVHLGQQDMLLAEARKLLGPKKIIGISTRTVEQAVQAAKAGADYIAVGSMFPTGSKDDAELVGPERLREIRKLTDLPLVAIGGIGRRNAAEVLAAGADSLALISAVMQDQNPGLAAREISLLFNRDQARPNGKILTIAGSDSGGGAGIQADLKVITLLGSYGTSAITALTAQNSQGVIGIHPCPPDFVGQQIDAVLEDFGADTIKTGMLFSAEIVQLVAQRLRKTSIPAVVDPVMIAKGGAALLQTDAVEAMKKELMPATFLLTPNLPETEELVGFPVGTTDDMERAATALQQIGARHVLIKGGHLVDAADDLLLTEGNFTWLSSERIDTDQTHGTGCSYAAAIATLLAQGYTIEAAVS
ncbi:MAG: phosphomethylpyrimidine kinase, partial [Desulfuromonas sp.]